MTDTETQRYLDTAPTSREQQYQQLFATLDGNDGDIDGDLEAIEESILAIEKTRGFQVTISTGGPGEWLECTVDDTGELDSVTFCVAWWSPEQRTAVTEGCGLWRLAERMNPWQFE